MILYVTIYFSQLIPSDIAKKTMKMKEIENEYIREFRKQKKKEKKKRGPKKASKKRRRKTKEKLKSESKPKEIQRIRRRRLPPGPASSGINALDECGFRKQIFRSKSMVYIFIPFGQSVYSRIRQFYEFTAPCIVEFLVLLVVVVGYRPFGEPTVSVMFRY